MNVEDPFLPPSLIEVFRFFQTARLSKFLLVCADVIALSSPERIFELFANVNASTRHSLFYAVFKCS